jgi:protein Hikeshi
MFGLLIPGRRCLTDPDQVIVPELQVANQYIFSFMALPFFTHIIIFLLPHSYLPLNATATISMQSPASLGCKLLGEISNEKPSFIFESPIKNELPKARIQVHIEIAAREDRGVQT